MSAKPNIKTLYVSDLDGTLLRGDERISDFTSETINELVGKGMLFSYATARSFQTAGKVTGNIRMHIPAIVYNGTFVVDSVTGEPIIGNFFDDDINLLLVDLLAHDIYPMVYSRRDRERFSFVGDRCSRGMVKFLSTREGDPRRTEVKSEKELFGSGIFYVTCIDDEKKLAPIYEKYREKYNLVFADDVYSSERWLEFMPKSASKSQAILQLKELLKCDRVVSFGDGVNDSDMFRVSDECYAMENAVDSLKTIATGVINSNNDDGVAKWLRENALIT